MFSFSISNVCFLEILYLHMHEDLKSYPIKAGVNSWPQYNPTQTTYKKKQISLQKYLRYHFQPWPFLIKKKNLLYFRRLLSPGKDKDLSEIKGIPFLHKKFSLDVAPKKSVGPAVLACSCIPTQTNSALPSICHKRMCKNAQASFFSGSESYPSRIKKTLVIEEIARVDTGRIVINLFRDYSPRSSAALEYITFLRTSSWNPRCAYFSSCSR